MLRILIADGTPAAMQAERETFGIPANAWLFEAALRSQQPDIQCSSINVADGQDLPDGVSLGDFDGLMFSGSPLHIYDRTPEVRRQIDFARAAFTTGLPVWQAAGACSWRPWHLGEPSATIPVVASSESRERLPPPRPAALTRFWLRGLPFSTRSALISTSSNSCRQARRCWLRTSFVQFRRWRRNCRREASYSGRNTTPSLRYRLQPG